MSQLTVRCFGGFEVRVGESLITDFESLKAKALLAYLIVQRERSFDRRFLASLLWPDRPEDAARRNLRQAVYNLKTVLAAHTSAAPISAQGSELRFNPALDCRLDLADFFAARQRGISEETVIHHDLAAAVALYRGDFLAGFAIKDSPGFELWQLTEQERLRDQAVDSVCVLVESYLSRGELRLGLQYARRLLAIDPLSEQAHRYLMRLYLLSGRRRRALAEYEHLREVLSRELEVEPQEETQQLYKLILKDQAAPEEAGEAADEQQRSLGIGPLVPLVGRREPYRQLQEHWRSVLTGRCRLTLVEGEAGIGKTRLVRSFLDAASSQRQTTILKGRCNEWIPAAYQPFDQLLGNAISQDPQRARRALQSSAPEAQEALEMLIPEGGQLVPDFERLPAPTRRTGRKQLFESVASFLERLCSDNAASDEPLVLMLGDLQWARRETLELIEYLVARLAESPVWILGTCRNIGLDGDSPAVLQLASDLPAAGNARVLLGRLGAAAIEQLAAELVGDQHAAGLTGLLLQNSDGLPLAIAECINFLWDERILIYDAGRWHLRGSLEDSSSDLATMVRQRLRRLPASTRRLASQAAVIGQHFDARLLTEAADEHPRVVEVGLELMLERWLVRQHSDHWTSGHRERDLVLFDRGARLGNFEFSHRIIGEAMLEDIHPRRRRILHQEITQALEKHLGDDDSLHEVLGFHYREAGIQDRAALHLHQAACQALAVSATDTASYYLRQTLELLDPLIEEADGRDEAERWTHLRHHSLSELAAIT